LPGRFDPYSHGPLQTAVKLLGFSAFVVEPPLGQLASAFLHHCDLLIACVKITSYNHPAAAGSAPFSEPWSSNSYQVYSEEGADNVI
jgi:hypothetical protein